MTAPAPLNDDQIARAAQRIGCDAAAIRAVIAVEAGPSGFLPDGRPKILFEAHHFARLTKGRFTRAYPRISAPRWDRSLYALTAPGEHKRLEQAAALNRDAALQSCSWGRFQLMGFNYRLCGYETVQAFVNDMYAGEGQQLDAFVAYIQARGLADELREHRWAAFAHAYNGQRYAENQYDTKLERAYAKAVRGR